MLEQLLPTVSKLKYAFAETNYIFQVEAIVHNYNLTDAKEIISEIVQKYTKQLNEIAILSSNRPVVTHSIAEQYYQVTPEYDVIKDLKYLRLCLIAIGAIKCGLIKSFEEVKEELNI